METTTNNNNKIYKQLEACSSKKLTTHIPYNQLQIIKFHKEVRFSDKKKTNHVNGKN